MYNRINTSAVIDRYLNSNNQPLQISIGWPFRKVSGLFMFIYNLFSFMQVFKFFQIALSLNFPVFIMLEDNYRILKTFFTLSCWFLLSALNLSYYDLKCIRLISFVYLSINNTNPLWPKILETCPKCFRTAVSHKRIVHNVCFTSIWHLAFLHLEKNLEMR